DGAFSPNGRQVALLRAGDVTNSARRPVAGRVELWDWRTGVLLHERPLPSQPRAVDYRPDGSCLAVLCAAGELFLLNPTDGAILRQWTAHWGNPINQWYLNNGSVRVTPDGKPLVPGTAAPYVRVWDPDTGRERFPPLAHERDSDDVAFSPDGRMLATAGRDDRVRFWDLTTGAPAAESLTHPD